jgi:hypothetical protein
MQEYKKRVRLLAERYGATIDYANDDWLTLIASDGSICFTPTSKNDMNCKITSPKINVAFACPKVFVFDIVDRFAKGKPLDGYKPTGNPLALQEYIDEEHAAERVSQLRKQIVTGNAAIPGQRSFWIEMQELACCCGDCTTVLSRWLAFFALPAKLIALVCRWQHCSTRQTAWLV